MSQWFNKVEESQVESFNTIKSTFHKHYQYILNYFDRKSTNVSAESINAKIKDFRRAFRGVRDVKSLLFRLTKIFT
jgi:transposase